MKLAALTDRIAVGSGLSDVEIVRGLRAGDRMAWDALYGQYHVRVWRHVARLIGGNEEAMADVFQETMLAAARNGRTLGSETRLWAWLSAICHNQVALYWRKHYRNLTDDYVEDAHADTRGCDPAEALAREERAISVRQLLADMDSEQVALLTAKYIDGLTIAEMTDLLGGTVGSVRGKLARARKAFVTRFRSATT